jgi:hypothetical protein
MLDGYAGDMMMAASVPTIPATYVANGIFSGTVSGTTATITSVAFGTASATRKVVIGFRVFATSAPSTFSVTIGGVAATSVNVLTSTTGSYSALAYAVIPAGTSGTVVITTNGTLSSSIAPSVACWSVYDGNSAPSDFNSAVGANNTSARSVACVVPTGGFQLAALWWIATGVTGFTWSGATESHEITTPRCSMAAFSPGAGVSHSCSATPAAATPTVMQTLSWI